MAHLLWQEEKETYMWMPCVIVGTIAVFSSGNVFAMARQPKTKAECDLQYDLEKEKCNRADDRRKADMEIQRNKCRQMADPERRDRCMQDAEAAEEEGDRQNDMCKDRAKAKKEDCLRRLGE